MPRGWPILVSVRKMMCIACGKPYFFIHTKQQARCLKCGYTSEFDLPAYTPAYHLDKYAGDSLYARTLKTDPMMGQILDSLNIGNRDLVLEIGCGVGDYCGEISSFCRGIVGIDISVQIAASRFENRFLRASGERLPFLDNAFDKVLCVNVIEHILDPAELLSEIYRVLRSDGMLALTTPDISFFLHRLTLDETHLHTWNKEEFEKLITQFFDVIDSRHAGSLFKYYPLNLLLSKIIKPDLLAVCKKDDS